MRVCEQLTQILRYYTSQWRGSCVIKVYEFVGFRSALVRSYRMRFVKRRNGVLTDAFAVRIGVISKVTNKDIASDRQQRYYRWRLKRRADYGSTRFYYHNDSVRCFFRGQPSVIRTRVKTVENPFWTGPFAARDATSRPNRNRFWWGRFRILRTNARFSDTIGGPSLNARIDHRVKRSRTVSFGRFAGRALAEQNRRRHHTVV